MGLGSLTDAIGITNYGDQQDALNRAMEYFENITAPEERALELERLTSQGILTPEMAETILMESTAFADIRTDPKLKEAQYSALMAIQERAEEGLTASDKLELEKIRIDENTQARGASEAITQQAAMQGRGGGGLEMMQKMQNQQDSAGRQAMRDAQTAALSQEQKMAALMSAGQLSGQMRDQDFGEQSQVAKAKDYMDQFNVANQQQTEYRNTDAYNQAEQMNLAERQRLADANIGTTNQERIYDAGAAQRAFDNNLTLASARAGGERAQADYYGQQSASGLGLVAGLAQAGAMYGGYKAPVAASDINVKENIEETPIDIDNFLNEITGFSYDYKEPERHGEGRRLGVMAQDLEQSPMGNAMVEDNFDGEGTKGIDGTKAIHASLAGLARLNERLKKLEAERGRL